MDYFDINMECMKQYRPNMYQKLEKLEEYLHINRLDDIRSEQAVFGDQYLTIRKGAKQYRLNSCYHPGHEAALWVKQFQFLHMNSVITMFGFGSGSFVREILRSRGKSDTIFVYEPCPGLFQHVLHHYDITDIIKENKFVLCIEGINDFEFHNLLQNAVNITNITSQIHCKHPFYEDCFTESAIICWKEIKDNYIHAKLNVNTEMFFGKRYIENALYNTRFLRDSNRLLDFKSDLDLDIPAIIVAAGPSLKDNLEELRRAKGRAYVFVVDRILDYVLDEGLEPDFIVTIDPIKPVEFFTKRTDVKIPLLCELVSNWEVLDRHQGKKIIFGCVPFFQKMYDAAGIAPPMLTTGASVATAAFAACVQLGFKKIVLVGQDLAYDGEFSHAGGIAEKIARTRDVMVEAVNGGQVRSRSDWYEFLIWFKDMMMIYPDIQLIDAKLKGAKIQGSVNMPLKEVLDTYCTKTFDINEVLMNKKGTFTDDDMDKVRQYFIDSRKEFAVLNKKAKEAIKLCEKQIRLYKRFSRETPETEKNFKKISRLNEQIGEANTYLLLETFITASSAQEISEMYHFTDDGNADRLLTYEKSISIYKAIIEGTEFVEPLFDKMMECL